MTATPKILVIDDEKGLRDMLHFTLSKEGYDVITAASGMEGIQMASSEMPDIAIIDIKMPKMDGIEVLDKIKEVTPDLEVIMATGYGTMESAIESLRKGALDYIHKPFNLHELLAVILKALENKKLKSQLVSVMQLDKLKDELLSTLSHELNTPLTVIAGSVKLLMGQVLVEEEKKAEMLEILNTNVDRIKTLVETILDFSKMESGFYKIIKSAVSVPDMISHAIKHVQPLADKAKIRIMQDHNLSGQHIPPPQCVIMCDLIQIERVLVNLLTNAVTFASENGKIAVWFETIKDQVQIVIEDNGRGIEKEALPRIFDKFYRADNSLARKEYGLGLGLSICRGIIKLHGGSIRAESEGLHRGSRFCFMIPING
ncbi:response regulator [candidate division FCPU426 bacterium]|nr:response regulator [candidate division FCPU426 bacterium]